MSYSRDVRVALDEGDGEVGVDCCIVFLPFSLSVHEVTKEVCMHDFGIVHIFTEHSDLFRILYRKVLRHLLPLHYGKVLSYLSPYITGKF